jgi:hypothetical protein
MKTNSEIPVLNLLLQSAEKEVGEVLVIPFGSLSYSNPLQYDEFPFPRVNDLEVDILNNSDLDAEMSRNIAERFKQQLVENGYKTKDCSLGGVEVIFPDGSKRNMPFSLSEIHSTRLDCISLFRNLFTSELYGSNTAIQTLGKALEAVERERILYSLSEHYSFLYLDAKDLANKGNPKFYKRIAEMSKYRGEKPEIREAILKKFDEWKRYVDSGGKIEGNILDKLQGEWNTISTDYDNFTNSKKLIDENLIQDENGLYRLKVVV